MIDKKVTNYLLIVIVLIQLIIHYPSTPQSVGNDSFVSLNQGFFLVKEGSTDRYNNFLSIFGLYPYSDNLGATFLLAAVALVTDTDVEQTILFLSFSLSILTALGTFIFSRHVFSNNLVAITSVLVLITSKIYIDYTYWTYTHRAPFVSLIPVCLAIIFILISKTSHRNFKIKYSFLFIFLLIILASLHKMFYFIIYSFIVILVAYAIQNRTRNLLYKGFYSKFHSNTYQLFFALLVLVLYLIPLTNLDYYGTKYIDRGLEEAQSFGFLGSGDSMMDKFLAMGLLYGVAIGIVLVFLPVGFLATLTEVRYQKNSFMIFCLFSSCAFFWTDTVYFTVYFSVVMSVLISRGIYYLLHDFRSISFRGSTVLVFMLLIPVSSGSFPYLIPTVDHGDSSYISQYATTPFDEESAPDELVNAALFMKVQSPIPHHSSLFTARYNAYSNTVEDDVPRLRYIEHDYDIDTIFTLLLGERESILVETVKIEPTTVRSVDVAITYNTTYENSYIENSLRYHKGGNNSYNIISHTFIKQELNFYASLDEDMFVIYHDSYHEMYLLSYV